MATMVNGEAFYVPSRKGELIDGLERMGVYKIAGVPLARVKVKELVREYCRVRAAGIRRKQQCTARSGRSPQMSLFAAL